MISDVGAAIPRSPGRKPLITVTVILTAPADLITFYLLHNFNGLHFYYYQLFDKQYESLIWYV